MSLVRPSTSERVVNKQSDQKLHHDKQQPLREFFPGERVLVKDFRKDGVWWPATIAEHTAPKSYVVCLDDGRMWKRHIDQMRRAEYERKDARETDTSSQPVPMTRVPDANETENPPNNDNRTNEPQTFQNSDSDVPTQESPPVQDFLPVRRSSRVKKTPERLIQTMQVVDRRL